MKTLDYFNELYENYAVLSQKRIESFWKPNLIENSPNLKKQMLNEMNQFLYHSIMGYVALSVTDLFNIKISN